MHSSMAQKLVDYPVDFTDCQNLERLLEKLSLSREILRTIEQIACMLQSSSDDKKALDGHESEHEPTDLHQISRHINKIRGHMRTASALQHRAERTTILVSLLALMYENSF